MANNDTTGGPSSPSAYIALGSNLPFQGMAGPELLQAAVTALTDLGLGLRRTSFIWRSAPWPAAASQDEFHNAVVDVAVGDHTPQTLFQLTSGIEAAFGRQRRTRWEARTLDLDIIDFAGFSGIFGPIMLPHRRTHERAFVLAPLADLGWRHPVLARTAADLLAALPPGQDVVRVASFTRIGLPP